MRSIAKPEWITIHSPICGRSGAKQADVHRAHAARDVDLGELGLSVDPSDHAARDAETHAPC